MEESTIQSISQVIMLLFSPIALWLAWRSTKAWYSNSIVFTSGPFDYLWKKIQTFIVFAVLYNFINYFIWWFLISFFSNHWIIGTIIGIVILLILILIVVGIASDDSKDSNDDTALDETESNQETIESPVVEQENNEESK